MRRTRPPVERFWRMVDQDGPISAYRPDLGPCWLWTGRLNGPPGYGRLLVNGVLVRAHRFAYELLVGPIPERFEIDHLCRVRHCVNPAHLEAVTHRENDLRSPHTPHALNAAKTHCKRGHPFDTANTLIVTSRGRLPYRSCRACIRRASRDN